LELLLVENIAEFSFQAFVKDFQCTREPSRKNGQLFKTSFIFFWGGGVIAYHTSNSFLVSRFTIELSIRVADPDRIRTVFIELPDRDQYPWYSKYGSGHGSRCFKLIIAL
jgi:hypothetical protein